MKEPKLIRINDIILIDVILDVFAISERRNEVSGR